MAELIDNNFNRDERRRSAAPFEQGIAPTVPQPNRVRSFQETADLAGISLATLRRRIKDGTGPVVTKMSPRRKGVTDRHREQWLEECARDQAGDSAYVR